MSSCFVTVVNVTHQYKIPCTPGKIMNEILCEACSRANLDPDLHGLRHGKTNRIDLSLPFRLTTLHAGAKLDLIRVSSAVDANVNVALNLSGVPRKVALVPARSSLWDVLLHFQEVHHLAITNASEKKDGSIGTVQPVVTLMNKEYDTEEKLQSTTLSSLGIKNGSAVIRVSFKSAT